jgi:hypothetical protein
MSIVYDKVLVHLALLCLFTIFTLFTHNYTYIVQ